MRRINEKEYKVWSVPLGTDEYGQRLGPVDTGRTVRANIATETQLINEGQAPFVFTYYFGLTMDRQLEVGNLLEDDKHKYLITSVNNDARRTQLTLELL